MHVTLCVHFVCNFPRVVLRRLKVHWMLVSLFLMVVIERLDEALSILLNKVICSVFDLVFITSFVTAAIGLTVADAVVRFGRVKVNVTEGGLITVLSVHVAWLTSMEGLVLLIDHWLLNDEFDRLMRVISFFIVMQLLFVFRDQVVVAVCIKGHFLNGQSATFLLLRTVVISVFEVLMVVLMSVVVVKRVVDFMLCERRRGNVVLVIVLVIKFMMGFMVDWLEHTMLTFASVRRIDVHFSMVFTVHEMKRVLLTSLRTYDLRSSNFRTLIRNFLQGLGNLSDLQGLTVVSGYFNMWGVDVRDWVLIVVCVGVDTVPIIFVLNVVVGLLHYWFECWSLLVLSNVVNFVFCERLRRDVVVVIEVVIKLVVSRMIYVVPEIVVIVGFSMNSWHMMGRNALDYWLLWNRLRDWLLWDPLYDRLW